MGRRLVRGCGSQEPDCRPAGRRVPARAEEEAAAPLTLAKKKDTTMSQMTSLVKALKAWPKVRVLVATAAVTAQSAHAPTGSGSSTSPTGGAGAGAGAGSAKVGRASEACELPARPARVSA